MRAVVALFFLIAATAFAGPFEDGLEAYGRGDYATALRQFRAVAEQGNAGAQSNLGHMYREGKGVPKDDAEAAKWYRRAADQGEANAQISLGVMYYKGEGVPQDYVQAHKWWNLAASRLAGSDRDGAVKRRDLVASEMTPQQIAEAQRLAREWKPGLPKAAPNAGTLERTR